MEANGPMILIPKHAFSPEIMGGVINHLTLSNKFLYDGDVGTLSHSRRRGQVSPLIPRVQSTPASLSSRYGSYLTLHVHMYMYFSIDNLSLLHVHCSVYYYVAQDCPKSILHAKCTLYDIL